MDQRRVASGQARRHQELEAEEMRTDASSLFMDQTLRSRLRDCDNSPAVCEFNLLTSGGAGQAHETSQTIPLRPRRRRARGHPAGTSAAALLVAATLAALASAAASLVIHVTEGAARRATVGQEAATAVAGSRGRSGRLLEVDALNYLHRYGYMNSSSQLGGNLISEDSFHEAIMQFQRFAGIPETGAVDSATMRYMAMPRCGNKDLAGRGENGKRRRRRRRKRYALQGSKWRRQELTYRISQYPTRFLNKKHEVDGQIERAFGIWSQVAPIDFVVKREGRVHIDIRFAAGEHGDGDPFDGPGNTLAHAYFPQYGGDAHFDDQEYWTVDSYAGTNIFQVAAHELGHSLGLGHSSVREALMAPFYQKYKPNFRLHADDVLAIQALYGERPDADASTSSSGSTAPTPGTEPTSVRRTSRPPGAAGEPDEPEQPSRPAADLCQEAQIDAITRTEDGNTYVFRGQHYWQVKNDGLAGPGARIARDWDGLPGNLDAALTWSDGKTFFFKADKYWRFFNKRREPGYPKQISVGFAGIPNHLDAAFVWGGNGKTYFFKRDKYWRFDSKQEPPVGGQYPKPVKNWAGLPAGGVDAAFKWDNGMTYFFKDQLYYRFDDREFQVDTLARPAFPRSTAEWWFGCDASNLPVRRAPADSAADLWAASSQGEPGASSSGSSGSFARSIIASLGSLFPLGSGSSASADSGAASSSSPAADEWDFHRGLGEEVRRRLRPAGDSRWSFLAAGHRRRTGWAAGSGGAREESLSELTLGPPAEESQPLAQQANSSASSGGRP